MISKRSLTSSLAIESNAKNHIPPPAAGPITVPPRQGRCGLSPMGLSVTHVVLQFSEEGFSARGVFRWMQDILHGLGSKNAASFLGYQVLVVVQGFFHPRLETSMCLDPKKERI